MKMGGNRFTGPSLLIKALGGGRAIAHLMSPGGEPNGFGVALSFGGFSPQCVTLKCAIALGRWPHVLAAACPQRWPAWAAVCPQSRKKRRCGQPRHEAASPPPPFVKAG